MEHTPEYYSMSETKIVAIEHTKQKFLISVLLDLVWILRYSRDFLCLLEFFIPTEFYPQSAYQLGFHNLSVSGGAL